VFVPVFTGSCYCYCYLSGQLRILNLRGSVLFHGVLCGSSAIFYGDISSVADRSLLRDLPSDLRVSGSVPEALPAVLLTVPCVLFLVPFRLHIPRM